MCVANTFMAKIIVLFSSTAFTRKVFHVLTNAPVVPVVPAGVLLDLPVRLPQAETGRPLRPDPGLPVRPGLAGRQDQRPVPGPPAPVPDPVAARGQLGRNAG